MESAPIRITRNTYAVGGPASSDISDCYVYLVDLGGPLVLIDAGAGRSVDRILRNISQLGLKPENIALLVLTHEHIDHIGGAAALRSRLSCKVAAHQAALLAITRANPVTTTAQAYGMPLQPCPIDIPLAGDAGPVPVGSKALRYLHTPGHTPGSIVLYINDGERRVLFGQDLHGPFNPAWGSQMDQWRTSMQLVLALEADILCEGHYGVYRGKSAVRQFIQGLLAQQT